ncbi:MAG TPA: response regulator [Mucilaginibacter sp.]|jgi:CheY-like chemotaxis protein|nr:response regulator [Mucilaginibacter sp.]
MVQKKILIVEDEFIIADVLKNTLENAGYFVCGIAATVKDTLDLIKKYKPNLILLDIYLKGSLTGIDLANRLNFQLEVEDIRLDVNQAVPFGLILNEAITNSIKYAFPDSRAGLIKIILREAKEYESLLVIADNGVGLPLNFNIDALIHWA